MPRQCSHSILQPFSPGAVQLNAAYFHNFTAVHFAPYKVQGLPNDNDTGTLWSGSVLGRQTFSRGSAISRVRRRCPVCSGYFFEVALDLVCQFS